MSKLAPAQKKKLKKEAEGKSEESTAGGVSKSGKRNVKPVDPDPRRGKVEEPMAEASKVLNMRKQKFLLAFQAVKRLLKLDAENPDSHRSLGTTSAPPTTEAEKLRWSLLEAERPSISRLQNKSLVEANKEFLARHEDSLVPRAAYAEMLYLLDPSKKTESIKIIEDSANKVVQPNGDLGLARMWKLKDCTAVHKLLDTVLLDSEAASRWKSRCAEHFPCSTYFQG
ncbi:tetratricopeptide repeat (TPR)-containing protein [Raphanus sativus]|nr:tetratricopeptide repeat (TPR)-containing protein [Raphanus sativus]